MANAKNVSPERYCQDVMNSAIHYTGDKQKWTPNAIRRVLISPDVVGIEIFNGRLIQKRLNPQNYIASLSTDKYYPMISALAGEGNSAVCSHIEEVIVCPRSVNGQVYLNDKEADFRYLVKSGTATKESLMQRYVRLRSVIVLNTPVDAFLQWYNSPNNTAGHKLDKCLCDEEWVKGNAQNIIEFNTSKTWYKKTAWRPQFYPADAEGSALRQTLAKLKAKMEALESEEKLNKSRDERLGSLKGECAKLLSSFTVFAFCASVLRTSIMADNGNKVQRLSGRLSTDTVSTLHNQILQLLEKAEEYKSKILPIGYLARQIDANSTTQVIGGWCKALGLNEKYDDSHKISKEELESNIHEYKFYMRDLWLWVQGTFRVLFDNASESEILASYIACGGGVISVPESSKVYQVLSSRVGDINFISRNEKAAVINMTAMLIEYIYSEDYIKMAKLGKEYLQNFERVSK